jgi:hypothetical protein
MPAQKKVPFLEMRRDRHHGASAHRRGRLGKERPPSVRSQVRGGNSVKEWTHFSPASPDLVAKMSQPNLEMNWGAGRGAPGLLGGALLLVTAKPKEPVTFQALAVPAAARY